MSNSVAKKPSPTITQLIVTRWLSSFPPMSICPGIRQMTKTLGMLLKQFSLTLAGAVRRTKTTVVKFGHIISGKLNGQNAHRETNIHTWWIIMNNWVSYHKMHSLKTSDLNEVLVHFSIIVLKAWLTCRVVYSSLTWLCLWKMAGARPLLLACQ